MVVLLDFLASIFRGDHFDRRSCRIPSFMAKSFMAGKITGRLVCCMFYIFPTLAGKRFSILVTDRPGNSNTCGQNTRKDFWINLTKMFYQD